MVAAGAVVSGSSPDENKPEAFPEVCGLAVRCYRPLSHASGEALMIAAEALARLVLQEEWSEQDIARMRDLARHAMGIINSVSTPPVR